MFTKREIAAMAWGYGTSIPLGLIAIFLSGFYGLPYSTGLAMAALIFFAGFLVTFWRLNR